MFQDHEYGNYEYLLSFFSIYIHNLLQKFTIVTIVVYVV